MDYIGMKCPVCKNAFADGDDVVVCAECGAPYHRSCYEIENKCTFEDMHSDSFVYVEENGAESSSSDSENEENAKNTANTSEDYELCPLCKNHNPKGTFYCNRCGSPLNSNFKDGSQQQPFNGVVNPFNLMAGIDPETDMGEGVTAGELSKFTQDKSSYFTRIFLNIKNFGRNRFNFAGLLFGGGYLLYRKMYKLGTFLTLLMAICLVGTTYIMYCTPFYNEYIALNDILNAATNSNAMVSSSVITDWFFSMSTDLQIMTFVVTFLSILQIAIQIIVGIYANKWYFKHCKKQIIKIKNGNQDEVKMAIETKGGVNTALAFSLFAVYIIINYAPILFS